MWLGRDEAGGDLGLLAHPRRYLEGSRLGTGLRGLLGPLLLIWALGLGTPGDALSVDLETDLATAQARTVLKLDLRGRGCSESLVSAGDGGLRADGYGDSAACCVYGVRSERGSVQRGIAFRCSFGSRTGERSQSPAGIAPETVLTGGIHGVPVGRLNGIGPGSCCCQSSCVGCVTGIPTVQDGVSEASHEPQRHECDECSGDAEVGQDAAAFGGRRSEWRPGGFAQKTRHGGSQLFLMGMSVRR